MNDSVTSQTDAQFGSLDALRRGDIEFDQARPLCRGCSQQDRCQLGIEVGRDDSIDGVSGTVTFPMWCEGGPGVVHGGMTLAALDEVSGLVHTSAGILAVTAGLNALFHRPVPVSTALAVTARLTGVSEDGSRRYSQAEIIRGDGKLLAEAAGEFVVRDPQQHFSRAATVNETAQSGNEPTPAQEY